jgi:cytochrome P450
LSALLRPYSTPEEYARAKTGSDAVVGSLGALVDAKREAPGDDLVTALLQSSDGEERLTDQELRSTIFQLIVAGHDTTTTLIGNGLVSLLRHPDQLALVRAEPHRLAGAIEELLRFDSPVPHSTFRYAVEPVAIANATIPAGAQVIISLAAANRDATRYVDPDEVDIDRPYVRHLAFGHGIHFCLGAALARMEGEIALGSLLRRFPQLRLAGRFEDLHWGHGDGLVLRGLSQLSVVPGPSTRRSDTTGERTQRMARKVIDCRDFPSETGCTLSISGTEMEVIQAAAEHAVSTHGHLDGPQLRQELKDMLKDEAPALQ